MSLIRDEDHLREVIGIPFSTAQMAAITAPLEAPSAIIAGAGSGKTTVMAARVVWLVGHVGVDPQRILGLTFTAKAAAELGQRILANLERLGVDLDGAPTTATYHAFAGQLIAEHGLRLGIEPSLQVSTDASRFQRAARVIEAHQGDLATVSTHLRTVVESVIALDAEMSEHLVSAEQLAAFEHAEIRAIDAAPRLTVELTRARDTQQSRLELLALVQEYRAAKHADGVMDFSDQMAWGAQLAQLPEVRAGLRERFDVVLLDEYQDTSVAQRDLLLALFGGMAVTAVGDPAQGIYGWRGAASGNLEGFLGEFTDPAGPAGRQFSLVQTRRCAPAIIDAANDLAQPFYASSGVVKPLESAVESDGSVDTALYPTVQDEIEAVVAAVVDQHGRGTAWREIALLVRINRENAAVVAALRAAEVPFEIVGLAGLLDQPEIVDLLSLLAVVDDATANPELLRLLTGPRWNVGARDLALLGRRAAQLAWVDHPATASTLTDDLRQAVQGTDPTDIVSLLDAVEDPGPLPFSEAARHRFSDLARIVADVRRHVGDPLIEVVRRCVRALDLDVELEASGLEGASDNLAVFLDAVADYAEGDAFASLTGLMAFLAAEREYADGLEVSTPSQADSVKLLTIHRSKGLEWDVVFVPFMSTSVFPSDRGRARWPTAVKALPTPLRGDADTLPALTGWSTKELKAFEAELKEDSLMEELRLGYVAYTRARTRLVLSGHWWGRTQKRFRGPSPFLERTRDQQRTIGRDPLVWAERPQDDDSNPLLAAIERVSWPADQPSMRRRAALADAVLGHLAAAPPRDAESAHHSDATDGHDELDAIAADLDLLLAEADAAASTSRGIDLPSTLSATALLSLAADEGDFARRIARPMPRRPSPAARLGTRFHAWVESHFGQQPLLDPTELPGRGDIDLESDAELDAIIEAFQRSEFGDAAAYAVEAPFSVVLAGHQVMGRIDAVFSSGPVDDQRFEVVDWKTNRVADADPLQLAVYRLAWAEMMQVPLDHVSAAFYYVRLDHTQRFADLPGRVELERLITGPSTTLGA